MRQTGSATAKAPARAVVGERLAGRYEVQGDACAGGLGVVYRVRDTSNGRVVAFKQLSTTDAVRHRGTAEAMFAREYHSLVRLRHPSIIEVYDYGVTDGGPYYTMELLGGADAARLGAQPFRTACRHVRDVASSLALLHAHGLVHRDVSPYNIRLTGDGRAKLLDFGAITSFGPASEVIGTPPCMAPEAFYQMPLDGRTDLFSLGGVLYFALTGEQAFPARRAQELPDAWKIPPPPPSAQFPEVPEELDRLVLSLLSLDPLARPQSAAEVIDRLTAIADLPSEEHEQIADAYLKSSRMVGRETEREWVQRRFARAFEERGAEVVIEGVAGVGKTRLLDELSLDARMKGAIVVKADAEGVSGPFGTAALLVASLLATARDVALARIGPHGPVLRHLSARVSELLPEYALAPSSDMGSEYRARLQNALHGWFSAIARDHVIAIAVDNLQAADDASAAFLAALGQDARKMRLLLMATLRSGEPVLAQAPVKILRQRSGRLKLAPLDVASAELLVRSLFGDVQNRGRVARWLHDRSAGIPQHLLDLAHLLVKRKIARYAGGTWVLPLEVHPEELPSRAEEILTAKLSGLGARARELAEALCVHVGPVPLETCLSLLPHTDEPARHAALDELLTERIVLVVGGAYRFAQESVREALLARMDAGRRRASHLSAAEAFLAAPDASPGSRLDAALHLMLGGEESRGADLLARDGWQFIAARGDHDTRRITRALKLALDIYEEQGRSEHEIARLVFPLVAAAFFSSDYHLVLDRGLAALELGFRITGLERARRLEPFLGRNLARSLGLAAASAELAGLPHLGYDVTKVLGWCCAIVAAVCGTASICLDTERAERIRDAVEPLALLDEHDVPAVMYEYACAHCFAMQGREREAEEILERARRRFEEPAIQSLLGEGRTKSIHGGILFSLGILDAYKIGDAALKRADAMDALGVGMWAMGAAQVRLLYHAYRGEIVEAERCRERVEFFALQGSTTWQVDMFLPALLLNADFLTSDTISARRRWEQLGRRAKEVAALAPYERAAQAAYLSLRGDQRAAAALYETCLVDFPPRGRSTWAHVHAALSRVWNASRQHQKARDVALAALAFAGETERAHGFSYVELERQLALAEAGLGNHAEAARMLDALLERHGAADHPLIVGLLYKARAEVAILTGDAALFEACRREVDVRFRATKNPALIALCERLAEASARTGVRVAGLRDVAASGAALPDVTIASIGTAADPCSHALAILVAETRARSGFLYLFASGSLYLAAATSSLEAPPAARLDLERRLRLEEDEDASRDAASVIDGAADGDDGLCTVTVPPEEWAVRSRAVPTLADQLGEAESGSVFVASLSPPVDGPPDHQILVLRSAHEGKVLGGVILETEPHQLYRLRAELLEAIANTLHAHAEELAFTTSVDALEVEP